MMATKQRRSTRASAPQRDGLSAADRQVSRDAEREQLLREAERARAEAEAERQRFRHLFLQAPTPVVLLRGAEHMIELANPPALQVWGRIADEVLDKPILDALPELRDQGVGELLDGVFTTGQPHHGTELRVQLDRRGDGNLEDVYFTFVYEPMRDATGTIDGVMVIAFNVTDQVLARHAVEESEHRLEDALAAGQIGTWVWDIPQNVLRADERLVQLFGLDPAEAAAGQPLATYVAMIHPDDRPRVERLITEAIATGQPYEAEYRVRGGDHRLRWVVARGHVTYDETGQPRAFPGAVADITERKQAEAALHHQQEQLQIALAASDTGTFRWDPAADAYLTFDVNLKRLFGFAPDDPVRVTEDKLARVHPDDVEALRAAIERRRRGADFEMDYRVVLPDGTVRWLHDRGKMEHDAAGRPTYLVGACTDITQRKQSELAAREAAERMRILAEMMPQKIFTATPTGEVDYFNPQWMSYTGLSFEQLCDWGRTQIIHPDDVEENVRVWRQSVATGEPFQFEHRFRRADGVYHWHLTRALPITDELGQVIKWLGSSTDIDDQKRAMQQKDEFVSIAAHELKSPVTALKGQVQLLHRRLRRRGELESATRLAKLDIQLDRLTRLISELLDVSRLQTGQLPLHYELIDVDALLAETIEVVQQPSVRHRIVVEGTSGLHLWGDRERIGQVLTNLLTNAIKYSPQADTVVVHAAADDREIHLGVQDFGIGLAPDEQRKIFDRFYRVADSALGTVTGWGLGLYITAEIIRRHGGRIDVESEPGQGTTFWVHLPANSAKSVSSMAPEATAG